MYYPKAMTVWHYTWNFSALQSEDVLTVIVLKLANTLQVQSLTSSDAYELGNSAMEK